MVTGLFSEASRTLRDEAAFIPTPLTRRQGRKLPWTRAFGAVWKRPTCALCDDKSQGVCRRNSRQYNSVNQGIGEPRSSFPARIRAISAVAW